MKQRMKFRGLVMMLALLLTVGTPLCALQTPVEVSAARSVTIRKTGLKLEDGKFYYYKKGVKIKNKWMTIRNKKYYFQSDGAAAVGWSKIQNKAYYFASNAVMVKNKKVDGVKINARGQASLTNSRIKLIFKAKLVAAKLTRKAEDDEEKLEACYEDVLKYRFIGKFGAASSSGWEVKSAYDMLVTKRGNSYSFAAAFGMLARQCGYDAKIVMGKITKNTEEGEVTVNHAWVEINGRVYDPQTQQATGIELYGVEYSEITQVSYDIAKKV